ncbi:hypothetical protein SH1V18_32580 [Vallitalea longa]|uniref:LXG domain-containing protein n=1 Tax=Vallitalea longa TaxID=2936439 RepID=A0A9W5YGI7_9FIRM|nr:hypothetical protein [Vallitalea longa]GKX30778.1 hypothetical protein SH1V18_32580 [Vallitalea longa]
MGYTKYDLDRLRDKENDIKRITENIDSIYDEFKGINNAIDIDIKLRDNIYNQFNTLIKDLENLVERTYNADKVINAAIFEYSSGEQQINTIFNGLVDIANMFHDKSHAQTQPDKTSITGISIIQKWFRGLKDYFKSKIDHIKNFLDGERIRINNKAYSKTNNNSDIKISYLSSSQNNFDYTSKERIKKIQQFLKNKGINIEVTGKLDRATFQASLMVGINELKDNGFIQQDSFREDDNIYTYTQNNNLNYKNPRKNCNENCDTQTITLFDSEAYDYEMNMWEQHMRNDLKEHAYGTIIMDYIMWKLTSISKSKDYIVGVVSKSQYESNGTPPEITQAALNSALTYDLFILGQSGIKLFNKNSKSVITKETSKAEAENVADFEKLRSSLAADEIVDADRVSTALSKSDPSHLSGSFLTKEQIAAGKVYNIRGGDGIQRTLLQTKGALNGKTGIFEYILTPVGNVSHQRFIPGGIFTGYPNQVVPKGGW